MDPHERDSARTREARRDLERLTQSSEVVGTSSMRRTANQAAREFLGEEESKTDPAEIWGRRIGRVGGLVFMLFLVYMLITTYIL